MTLRRILGCAVAAVILAAGLAGCTQYDVYGTMDTGVGVRHYSTQ
jgi:type IV pilus biogenesis protein CpaD/CtpE